MSTKKPVFCLYLLMIFRHCITSLSLFHFNCPQIHKYNNLKVRYQRNSLVSARQVYHAWFQSCTEEYPHCQPNFFPKCHLIIFMSCGVQGHFLCWFPCLKTSGTGTTWCCPIIWVSHCSPSLGRLLPWCRRGDWEH